MARIVVPLLTALLLTMLVVGTVGAHNAGCVPTGSGEWVFVGSNKEGPIVPEANPNKVWDEEIGDYRLDLQPGGPGDQFGARHAADQGGSAVARPSASLCSPPGPRADNAP